MANLSRCPLLSWCRVDSRRGNGHHCMVLDRAEEVVPIDERRVLGDRAGLPEVYRGAEQRRREVGDLPHAGQHGSAGYRATYTAHILNEQLRAEVTVQAPPRHGPFPGAYVLIHELGVRSPRRRARVERYRA